MAVKGTFPKIIDRKYHNTVHNNTEPNNPNTAKYAFYNLNSIPKIIKILTVEKITENNKVN
jgi:hypothetical protein